MYFVPESSTILAICTCDWIFIVDASVKPPAGTVTTGVRGPRSLACVNVVGELFSGMDPSQLPFRRSVGPQLSAPPKSLPAVFVARPAASFVARLAASFVAARLTTLVAAPLAVILVALIRAAIVASIVAVLVAAMVAFLVAVTVTFGIAMTESIHIPTIIG